MSLRVRLAVLLSAGLIAAGYTAALAVVPLCAVFRSMRHYSTRTVERRTTAPTASAAELAARH
jgi:hypothetical protein